ncbi:glycoside hydrolase family 1 protein [Candidatus Dormiibacter inghamiae]|uniref:glycoside hydrolase family 1 protein n=1 Tax=Candidatus Dormiibacter inghamiae TaxID=3127013 RepID=UPI0030C72E7C
MERGFPEGFLWGCATAAHQVEGGNHNNDWWEFEQRGGIRTGDSSDPACDHYHRFAGDFRQLRQLGQNAHRLSIEWSRVEPAPGEFDLSQLRHYRDVLSELREQGLSPMVTLHHFTSPLWFTCRGGWAAAGSPAAWLPFVRRVAEELGHLVSFWCTLNEPLIYAYMGWLDGEFPPGRRGDWRGTFRVLANLRRAHEEAYRALHRITPQVPVGIANHRWPLLPHNPKRRLDRLAARVGDRLMTSWPVGRGRLQRVVEAPSDFLGVNHYSRELVRFTLRRTGQGFVDRSVPPGLPLSDFGWAVEPDWLREALLELKPLGKPVYITENGIASVNDEPRQSFLPASLAKAWEAIQAGVDLRGYFHWTSLDNFEWARGYSMRFGLIGVDPETQVRTVKPSAELYARIARANALPDD